METAKNRLEVYNTQTAPLIDYYRKQGKLLELNGERPIEEVSKELLKKLGWRGDGHRH
jgi:adenylate kinase